MKNIQMLNYKNEEKNSKIYLIELQCGNCYSLYNGKLMQNKEIVINDTNPIYGYVHNNSNGNTYIINGYINVNNNNLSLNLLGSDKYSNLHLEFINTDNKYVEKNKSNKYIINKFEEEKYDYKNTGRIKRKVFNKISYN